MHYQTFKQLLLCITKYIQATPFMYYQIYSSDSFYVLPNIFKRLLLCITKYIQATPMYYPTNHFTSLFIKIKTINNTH